MHFVCVVDLDVTVGYVKIFSVAQLLYGKCSLCRRRWWNVYT